MTFSDRELSFGNAITFIEFLANKGFKIDADSLDKLIEAAVFNLPSYIGVIDTTEPEGD